MPLSELLFQSYVVIRLEKNKLKDMAMRNQDTKVTCGDRTSDLRQQKNVYFFVSHIPTYQPYRAILTLHPPPTFDMSQLPLLSNRTMMVKICDVNAIIDKLCAMSRGLQRISEWVWR